MDGRNDADLRTGPKLSLDRRIDRRLQPTTAKPGGLRISRTDIENQAAPSMSPSADHSALNILGESDGAKICLERLVACERHDLGDDINIVGHTRRPRGEICYPQAHVPLTATLECSSSEWPE